MTLTGREREHEMERKRHRNRRGGVKWGILGRRLTCRLTQSGAVGRRDADPADAAGGANTDAKRLIRCAHGRGSRSHGTTAPRRGNGRLQLKVTARGNAARLLLLLRRPRHRMRVRVRGRAGAGGGQ